MWKCNCFLNCYRFFLSLLWRDLSFLLSQQFVADLRASWAGLMKRRERAAAESFRFIEFLSALLKPPLCSGNSYARVLPLAGCSAWRLSSSVASLCDLSTCNSFCACSCRWWCMVKPMHVHPFTRSLLHVLSQYERTSKSSHTHTHTYADGRFVSSGLFSRPFPPS